MTSRLIAAIRLMARGARPTGAVAPCLALILALAGWSGALAAPYTHPRWIPKLTNWIGDQDGNGIHDAADNADPNIMVFDNIVLDLNGEATSTDLADFEALGDVVYVSRMVSIVALNGVYRSTLPSLASHPRVAMVEWRDDRVTLDVGARAVRALPSPAFSPQTAAELGLDGTGITIAIMDTGIDNGGGPGVTHSALPAARNAAPVGGFDGCAVPPAYLDPDDVTFHGTHVAGIALGDPYVDAASGVVLQGVAPGARYADVRVCCGPACPAAAIAAGFDAVLDARLAWGIRVVNMSWGGLCGMSDGLDAFSVSANVLAGAGIVPVASAGNSGAVGLCSPCAADDVVCVASDNDLGTVPLGDDVISVFSSRGPRPSDDDGDPMDELKPDLAAPGQMIRAPQFNTIAGSLDLSGTSMASPHVAGGAALVLQNRPSLTVDQVKAVLKQTAADMDGASFPALDPSYDTAFGQGILNAYAAAACSNDAECQDGVFCNGEEVCMAGSCQPGPPPDCDDGSVCTADSCLPGAGCVHTVGPDAEIPAGLDRLCNTLDDNVTLFGPDGLCNTPDDTCGDGVGSGDVCPGYVDPAQLDRDGDGVGDACDQTACLSGTDGIFRSRASMRQARERHAAAPMPDGRVLVVGGGFDPPAEIYSPTTRTFATTDTMSVAPNRTGHTVTALNDGRVLVAAGWSGGALSSAQLFDPLTGYFSVAGDLVTARSGHTATLLASGKVLAAGGAVSIGGRTAAAELYEPTLGSFAPTGSLLEAREAHVAALLPDGRVLAAAGRGDSGVLGSAEIFNPLTGTWSFTDSMNVAREYAEAIALANGRVLVTGGRSASATVLASAEVYNPATGHFTLVGPMAAARMFHTMNLLPDGRVLITGGETSGAVPALADPPAELFEPATGVFTPLSSMVTPRWRHTATNLPGGQVLIAGGESPNQILSASEVFVPPEPAIVSAPDGASGDLGAGPIQVPVSVTDLTGLGIVSASFVLYYNPAVVQVAGVDAGEVASGCSVGFVTAMGSVSVSISCPAPMSGAGDLAIVSLDLIGVFNEVTPLLLSSSSLQPGFPSVCSENGSFRLLQRADISGTIRYYRDAATGLEPGSLPVPLVTVRLTGSGPSVPATTTSLSDGAYTFAGRLLGESYRITPAKTADFQSAITNYDAALNAQAVVGLTTLTPAQLLAADVSGNGRNTAFDSALIAEMAVGSLGRFPVADRVLSDWFASPAPAPAPNQLVVSPSPSTGVAGSIAFVPFMEAAAGQDFHAALFGDVSGNWPSGAPGLAGPGTSSLLGLASTGRLLVEDVSADPGSRVEVAISAEGVKGAIAFDLDLRFNGSVLRPVSVTAGPAAAGFTLNANIEARGRTRIGLFSATPIKSDGTLAVITFDLIGRPGARSVLNLTGLVDEGRIPVTGATAHVRIGRP